MDPRETFYSTGFSCDHFMLIKRFASIPTTCSVHPILTMTELVHCNMWCLALQHSHDILFTELRMCDLQPTTFLSWVLARSFRFVSRFELARPSRCSLSELTLGLHKSVSSKLWPWLHFPLFSSRFAHTLLLQVATSWASTRTTWRFRWISRRRSTSRRARWSSKARRKPTRWRQASTRPKTTEAATGLLEYSENDCCIFLFHPAHPREGWAKLEYTFTYEWFKW